MAGAAGTCMWGVFLNCGVVYVTAHMVISKFRSSISTVGPNPLSGFRWLADIL